MEISLKRNMSRVSKVPEVLFSFWVIKIMSTTVGETVADFLAFDAGWGQSITTLVMITLLVLVLLRQFNSRHYVPWAYWLSVVMVSVVGTQITDILTDSLGISLYVSTLSFGLILGLIFFVWNKVEGTLSIESIVSKKREYFYWTAILCTFALGTAAGDLATEALGLGFKLGVISFGVLIALTYVLHRIGGNGVMTFWIAYILTRPFGAAFGDFLTQPKSDGGLGIGAMWTSVLFLTVITFLVIVEQIKQSRVQTVNS